MPSLRAHLLRFRPGFAALCLVLSSAPLHATSIAVVRTSTSITIAADSLVTVADGNGLHQIRASKLHSAGGLYFTAAGITLDPDAGLNTTLTGAKLLPGPGSIHLKANLIAAALEGPLLRSFQMRQRSMSAADYADFMASGDTALDFLIAGFEGATPTVAIVSFIRVSNRAGVPVAIRPRVRMCPGEGCSAGTSYFILGYNREARPQYTAASFWRTDTATVARHIVQIEAKAQPGHVGLPIDVLVIHRAGAYWVAPYGLGRRPPLRAPIARPAYASPAPAVSAATRAPWTGVPTQR
jgi:hypothetical protein